MNCPNCTTQNEPTAHYCRSCGTNLDVFRQAEAKKPSSTPDILAMLMLAYMVLFEVIRLLSKEKLYSSDNRIIYFILLIPLNLSPLILALLVKNKNLKIVCLCIALILVMFHVYQMVEWMFIKKDLF